jgi:arylsulfatase A-like enzyme
VRVGFLSLIPNPSPTRVALKSGRNHHTRNMAFITEMATGLPGATGEIPNSVAPLAEMLRLNGYNTGAFGKWHETAVWETTTSGPYDRWPTHQGFDNFYGFMGGETNQWAPYIIDGVTPVELPDDPNYHFMADMTDQSIQWMQAQNAMTPDKPFVSYVAPGATHVPQAWIDK